MIAWDSTSFYRSWGILHNLNRMMGKNLQLDQFQGRQFTWAQLAAYDIVFFQRPARVDDLKLAEYCKGLGAKIWLDYDDNLFSIPNESRAYFDYDQKVRNTMYSLLQLADIVTVSTEELKKVFNTMKIEKVEVVPNAINDDFFKEPEEFNKDSKVVVWRGSETHVGDIVYFTEEIYKAISVSEDDWHFMGYNPFTLTNIHEIRHKIVVHKGEDVMIYQGNLKLIKPRIMHVPLVDNELNRSKSNIAWMEATYAGAVTIGPNWPEWNQPGVICYDTPDDYSKLLTTHSDDYAKCWKESLDYIKANLVLSKVNEQRKQIIESLCR